MFYDEPIIPELLPPHEDGVFKALLSREDASPILRDIVESFLHFPVKSVTVRNVELTKLDDVIKKPARAMTGEEAWASFFAYASDPDYKDLINKLILERKEIKMAEEMLHTISQDENERARFLSRRKFLMDQQHDRIIAQREGRAEGLAEGRAEGLVEGKAEGLAEGEAKSKAEIAQKLKTANKLSNEEIAQFTGLPLPEVEKLQ